MTTTRLAPCLCAELLAALAISFGAIQAARAQPAPANPQWTLPQHYRVLLNVDPRGRKRSNSPAAVEIDFQKLMGANEATNSSFDEHTIEVMAFDSSGKPRMVNPSQKKLERYRMPHRVDRFFGITAVRLNFVLPDHTYTNIAVYFDTVASGLGRPERYHGLVGDGDFFCEEFKQREISASHFDQLVDFDGDGDLDLFKGGVEPFVYCYENTGRNRLVNRGRLTSGGQLFTLPQSKANRSWVTVAFYDFDGDGDPDFFPSFGDGPDAGTIVFYRNTTRKHGGQLTFTRVGPLRTVADVPLAGGAQAGGWFPSITFVPDWDSDGRGPDAVVGSNHRCWLYRCSGIDAEGAPRFAEAVAVRAGGKEIQLINPRFDCADVDGDGDFDLFAATQPGAVYWFKNIGTRTQPEFAPGQVVAWDGNYLIGDAHSGVKVADVDEDGRPDLLAGRFWERADLNKIEAPHDFGGFFKNVGTPSLPRFERRFRGAFFTDQFQPCDAVRQNSVRAADWDSDGKPDLLAGDTDGFIWFYRKLTESGPPLFAAGEKLASGDQILRVNDSGGHARLDICDWNDDGKKDLLVADSHGLLTLFLNRGRKSKPGLATGTPVTAGGKPIQAGPRASVLVCDWDNDARKDIVLADDKGYSYCKNIGTDAEPLLDLPAPILFGGKPVKYVRPNLGSFVDWDGDSRKDFIGCHFENSIRFYRNIGSGAAGAPPQFADPEGVLIIQGESPQMISGAHAVDWNGDGDLDILTGQGHGGSGLRFYERDWIEDELNDTHPGVSVRVLQARP